jgi:hypothetical protein
MLGPAPFPEPPPIPQRTPPAPARKPRLPLWAGILFGVAGAFVLLIGAATYLFYNFGWKAFSEQAVTAMNEQPIVQRCIGTIESSWLDFSRTSGDPRENSFAFRIKGPAGSGQVTAVFTTIDEDNEQIDEGELKMMDGRVFTLQAADDNESEDMESVEAGCPRN